MRRKMSLVQIVRQSSWRKYTNQKGTVEQLKYQTEANSQGWFAPLSHCSSDFLRAGNSIHYAEYCNTAFSLL